MRATPSDTARALGIALACVVSLGLGGCYDVHVRGEGGVLGPGDASPTSDASDDDDGGIVPFDAGPLPPLDAGVPFDAGVRDGGARDASLPFDAGVRDAGLPLDAGARDAGLPLDAGARDAGLPLDAGARDAGLPLDAGARDAGLPLDGGRRSVALRFSDTTFTVTPPRPGLRVGVDSTYEMWMRARGPGFVSCKGQDDGQRHLSVEIRSTDDGRLELVAGWVTVALAPRLLRAPLEPDMIDRWTHVALVVMSAGTQLQAHLYVDFTRVATGTFPDDIGAAFNNEPLRLGRFDGDLDEVRVWRSVRSVATLASSALMRIPSGTPTLAAYWPMEEAPSQLVLDRSLQGNDSFRGVFTSPDAADPVWIFDGAL